MAAILVCLPFASYPQTEEPTTTEVPVDAPAMDIATVVVDGEQLFDVRGSSVAPAQKRADNVAANIIEAAELSDRPIVQMDIINGEFGPTITADGIIVTVVTTADAKHEDMDLGILEKVQAKVIEETILKYRSDRSKVGQSKSIKRALLWTLPFLLITYLLFWGRNRVENGVEKLVIRLSSGIDAASRNIIQSSLIVTIARTFVRVILFVIFLSILNFYLSVLFSAFAQTRYISNSIAAYVTAPIIDMLVSTVGHVPNIILLVLLFMLTKYVVKLVRLVFENIESGNFKFEGFEKQWIWPTYNLLRVFIWIVWFILAFPYIPGSDSQAFKGVSILLGVMVSMGSNSVVSNLLAGIFVIYRRSTSIGDRIKVGNHVGDVVAIKLMETHLRSIKNELVSIPNVMLMNSDVINYSSKTNDDGLLVNTIVGIGYEEPQKKIEALLIEAALRTIDVEKTPKPFVFRNALADYAVNYQVNAYTKCGQKLPEILSDLHANILDVFSENHVQIMTPSYMADPDVPKIAPASMPNTKK
jgi:small-conductance mechanosensitive channel